MNIFEFKYNILLLFICFNFLIPSYLTWILSEYEIIDLFQSLISIIFMIILIWKNAINLSFPLFWLIVQYAILIVSSYMNHGSTYTAIINSVLVVALCMTLDIIVKDERKIIVFLSLVRNIVLLFFLINILFTIIMPNGIPGFSSASTPYFLYGNMNTTVKYVFPGLCCSILLDRRAGKKMSVYSFLFFIGILYLCLEVYFMATAFVGMLFVFLWILFKPLFNRCLKLCYVGVVIIVFLVEIFIVISFGNTPIALLISDLFGKDITFSGRALLWQQMLYAIHNNPILGYGLRDSDYVRSLIGISAGAHNYYLDLSFQRGLVGLGAFFSIFIYILVKLKNKSDDTYLLLGFVGAYLLMFISEPFYFTEKFHMPIIYILAILLSNKKRKSNVSKN